eukprot:scaffold61_cov205-Alexandrium_tamarense.AAC.17
MTIEKSLPVWKHEDNQSSIASTVKRLSAVYMLSLCPLSISRCHVDAAGYPPLRYICECNTNNSCRRTHLAGSAAYAQEGLVTVLGVGRLCFWPWACFAPETSRLRRTKPQRCS